MPRVFLSARPPRGLRVRRAAVASAAAVLLLLGAACSNSEAPNSEATAPSDDSVATLADPEAGTPIQGVVASAISEAPPASPSLPGWVTAKLDADPPPLAWPKEGATFTESYVLFSGKAEPGSIVAAGPFEAKADNFGQWSLGLVLTAGQNVATFTTISNEGVETKESVTVHFKPQYEDKHNYVKDGEHADKDHGTVDGFEAWQRYGSCGESVPYDIFKGKADPGTVITVTSPYGGGTATAGDDGYWKVKVTFEDAPVGEEFTVTVSDGSEVKTFTFTRKK